MHVRAPTPDAVLTWFRCQLPPQRNALVRHTFQITFLSHEGLDDLCFAACREQGCAEGLIKGHPPHPPTCPCGCPLISFPRRVATEYFARYDFLREAVDRLPIPVLPDRARAQTAASSAPQSVRSHAPDQGDSRSACFRSIATV